MHYQGDKRATMVRKSKLLLSRQLIETKQIALNCKRNGLSNSNNNIAKYVGLYIARNLILFLYTILHTLLIS